MTFGSGKRCKATGKRTGEQCKNPAMKDSDFCFLHGGRPTPKRGAPRGNKNNLRHGVNSETVKEYKRRITTGRKLEPGFLAFDILNKEERDAFLGMIGDMYEEFNPDSSTEYYEIELVAMCMILFSRTMKSGSLEAVAAVDRMIRLHLNNLRTGGPVARQWWSKPERGTTPAEWAASLVERVREDEARERAEAAQQENKTTEDEEHGE